MLAAAVIQISRCALVSMCPSDQELGSAVMERADQAAAEIGRAARAEHPGQIVWAEPRVGKIGSVHCGAPSRDDPSTIHCSFTVNFSNKIIYEVAKLTRRDGRWTIGESLTVPREIPPARSHR